MKRRRTSRTMEAEWIRYCVTEADLERAKRGALKRMNARSSYRNKSNQWSSGSIPGKSPEFPVFVGIVGEIAFAEIFSVWFPDFPSPDLAIRARGDGGIDFRFRGVSVDVKTAYQQGHATARVNEEKIDDATAYVFASLESQPAVVTVHSWATGEEFRGFPVKSGKRRDGVSTWRNRQTSFFNLRPISELISLFQKGS